MDSIVIILGCIFVGWLILVMLLVIGLVRSAARGEDSAPSTPAEQQDTYNFASHQGSREGQAYGHHGEDTCLIVKWV